MLISVVSLPAKRPVFLSIGSKAMHWCLPRKVNTMSRWMNDSGLFGNSCTRMLNCSRSRAKVWAKYLMPFVLVRMP